MDWWNMYKTIIKHTSSKLYKYIDIYWKHMCL